MRVYRARAGRAGTVALLQIDVVWTEATLAQTWLGSMIASCQRVAPGRAVLPEEEVASLGHDLLTFINHTINCI
ncbi:MAG: hypothetical protein KAV83_05985 [Desulfobacterales bacterium]|nr:hypothetical protein [Desulfobacterales bacterium]